MPSAVASHLGTDHTELYVTPRGGAGGHPARCRRSTTSRSPMPRRCRPSSSPGSRGSTSRWRCRAMAATSCSAATTAIGSRARTVGTDLEACRGRCAESLARGLDRAFARRSGTAWPAPSGRILPRLHAARAARREGPQGARACLASGSARRALSGAGLALARSGRRSSSAAPSRRRCWRATLAGARRPRRQRADDGARPADLSARRHPGQGRPGGDGVSLETRVPLLDHRVVEFAWRLPLDLKLRGGETKWALRADRSTGMCRRR